MFKKYNTYCYLNVFVYPTNLIATLPYLTCYLKNLFEELTPTANSMMCVYHIMAPRNTDDPYLHPLNKFMFKNELKLKESKNILP